MLSVLFGLTLSIASAQNIEIVFTNPECEQYGNRPVGSFCTRADLDRNLKKEDGVFEKLSSLISDPETKSIALGTMTFSNRNVATLLCQAAKNGVEVEIFLDAGAAAETARTIEKCGATLNLVGEAESENKRGDLHHNKFMLVQREKDSTVVFSTANFSNPGLTINHETWGFITDSNRSIAIQNHVCLIESLREYQGDMSGFRSNIRACKKNDTNQSVQSLFVPVESSNLVRLIETGYRESSRVLMTSNRFSFPRIINAAEKSQAEDQRAVFDDDLFWGRTTPTEDYKDEALDAQRVQSLQKAGVDVRFTQTSNKAAQKMHSKFIVFDDFVVVGAGNFTHGGLMANFENFYVIRDPEIIEQFVAQFEYLWELSNSAQQMPRRYPGE